MTRKPPPIEVRTTRTEDIPVIIDMCREVYRDAPPWTEEQLHSHLSVFPEGQFVAVHKRTKRVVGMAASLIVNWDDYHLTDQWSDFTSGGMFTNHDPENGRTLFGAEVMIRPMQHKEFIATELHQARKDLAVSLGLRRIRAGVRLTGYHLYSRRMSAEEYALRAVRGEIQGPTLTFHLGLGFRVLAVVRGYVEHDQHSLGWAAVIEWLNEEVTRPEDSAGLSPRFAGAV